MRSGWAVTTDHFFFSYPGRSAARVLRAGTHSTLHGVVFAILCPTLWCAAEEALQRHNFAQNPNVQGKPAMALAGRTQKARPPRGDRASA
ncbi:hypothetical protein V1293_000350 [Bradyrhizobium sp. AZCC 1693]